MKPYPECDGDGFIEVCYNGDPDRCGREQCRTCDGEGTVKSSERCHDCGSPDSVSVYDSGRVDRETGAADQIALCADCADTREVPTSAMVGERCPDCGCEGCICE